ncbi:target of EGR1 protein 1-like [Antedon mediterranea]|uniref:target of EGR1 protein 1-like n=1 Tax=Antedon mediterranea TaxID=105859 RepID=UPI003AF4985A
MATFEKVPVVDVHCENISIIWPSLLLAVRSSDFIGIDLELSGLGNRRNLVTRCMEDRYKFISEVAKSRSILAVGLACFKITGIVSDGLGLQFQAQTFNLTTLCNEEYVVEPDALQFLVNHGFDFNKQYSKGMYYSRGVDKETKMQKHNIRELITEMVACKKPVVFHNGLVDLVFLYENLYCPLPGSYSSFIADISEMFPGGIYDTKYIAEYKSHMNASYLEYVFRKSQRENAVLSTSGQKHIQISFCSYPQGVGFVEYRHCELPANLQEPMEEKLNPVEFCKQYGSHGWCCRGISCPYSHDPDIILDNEHLQKHKRKRKRNRKRKRSGNDVEDKHSMETDEIEETKKKGKSDECTMDVKEKDMKSTEGQNDIESMVKDRKENESSVEIATIPKTDETKSVRTLEKKPAPGKHRAGFDAFMTAYSLASFLGKCKHLEDSTVTKHETSLDTRFQIDVKNLLYLSGKSVPLLVEKSHFSKTSSFHREKIHKICPPKFKHITEVILESKGIH